MLALASRTPLLYVLLLSLATSCKTQPRWLEPTAEYFSPAARIYFDTGKDDPGELDAFQDGSLAAAVDFLGISFPLLVKEAGSTAVSKADLQIARAAVIDAKTNRDGAKQSKAAALQAFGGAPVDPARQIAAIAAQTGADLSEAELKRAEDNLKDIETKSDRAGGTRLDGDWIIGPRFAVGITGAAGDSDDGAEESSGAPVVYVSAGLFGDFYKGNLKYGDDDGVGVRLEFGYLFGISADESLADADDNAIFVGMTVFL